MYKILKYSSLDLFISFVTSIKDLPLICIEADFIIDGKIFFNAMVLQCKVDSRARTFMIVELFLDDF